MVIHATPELLRWVDEQLARGCAPTAMIDAMISVGHVRSFAESVIGRASGQTPIERPEAAESQDHPADDAPVGVPET